MKNKKKKENINIICKEKIENIKDFIWYEEKPIKFCIMTKNEIKFYKIQKESKISIKNYKNVLIKEEIHSNFTNEENYLSFISKNTLIKIDWMNPEKEIQKIKMKQTYENEIKIKYLKRLKVYLIFDEKTIIMKDNEIIKEVFGKFMIYEDEEYIVFIDKEKIYLKNINLNEVFNEIDDFNNNKELLYKIKEEKEEEEELNFNENKKEIILKIKEKRKIKFLKNNQIIIGIKEKGIKIIELSNTKCLEIFNFPINLNLFQIDYENDTIIYTEDSNKIFILELFKSNKHENNFILSRNEKIINYNFENNQKEVVQIPFIFYNENKIKKITNYSVLHDDDFMITSICMMSSNNELVVYNKSKKKYKRFDMSNEGEVKKVIYLNENMIIFLKKNKNNRLEIGMMSDELGRNSYFELESGECEEMVRVSNSEFMVLINERNVLKFEIRKGKINFEKNILFFNNYNFKKIEKMVCLDDEKYLIMNNENILFLLNNLNKNEKVKKIDGKKILK
jgi:hypothetical protein